MSPVVIHVFYMIWLNRSPISQWGRSGPFTCSNCSNLPSRRLQVGERGDSTLWSCSVKRYLVSFIISFYKNESLLRTLESTEDLNVFHINIVHQGVPLVCQRFNLGICLAIGRRPNLLDMPHPEILLVLHICTLAFPILLSP